jgi:hypothetical protein
MNDRCPGFRRSLAAVLAGVGSCSAPAVSAAPTALSDAALDSVTAGTLERDPIEPGKAPVVVVADGAHYVFNGSQSVELAEGAQTGLRALNVTGAAGGDVGNAVNVLAIGAYGGHAVAQNNVVSQTQRAQGSLGRATLGGTNVTRSTHVESRFADGSSTSSVTGRRLLAATRTTDIQQSAMFVPEFSPFEHLELKFETPTLAPIEIGEFGIDLLNDDGLFGIEGSVGPFRIEAPELVLGTARLDGDDVVFDSGQVRLPAFDLGDATVKVCFAACAEQSVDLGSFGGETIVLPGPDLRLEGANIFKDTHINAGFGIALVGSGEVDVEPGHLTLFGELSLDLPDPSFSFDFEIPAILEDGDGGDIIGPWTFDGPEVGFEIPPITVSHTFIDEDIGFAYSASFDGVLCLAVGTTDCGSASRRTERQRTVVDVVVDTTASSSHSERGGSMAVEIDTHAGASLRDAEADLIAMSEASAEVTTANTVTLGDAAQRGMSSLNAVNAADAIVGNALNVTVLEPSRWVSGSAIGLLSQSNAFSQYRTQYGLQRSN